MNRSRHRLLTRSAIGLAVLTALLLAFSAPVLAEHSDEPSYIPPALVTIVDGNPAEWAGEHVFEDLNRAGQEDKPVEANLFVRYDCATGVVYIHVDAVEGVPIVANLPQDTFVKIDGTKVVDSESGDDGTPPDFAWIGLSGDEAQGFEASFSLAEGTYGLDVHIQVIHEEQQTASSAPGNETVPLVLDCPELVLSPALTIAKTDSDADDSVVPGDDVTYTITATNTGTGGATGVVIADNLDDDLTVLSANFSNDGGPATACTTADGNAITCNVGALAAGKSAVATIVVDVQGDACGTISNTSSVDSGETNALNSNTLTLTVFCEATAGGGGGPGGASSPPAAAVSSPSPTVRTGTLPSTAMAEVDQTPSLLASFVVLAALASLTYLRLAQRRARGR